MGKPGAAYLLAHGWHSVSDWVVRSHTVYANLRETTHHIRKSDLYESLDPTEKGGVSYFIGMMAAKIVGTRLLDTPWLFHLSMLDSLGGEATLVDKSQPDLIGLNRRRDWLVVEAKGRTHGYSGGAMVAAKLQTGKLRQINGANPAARIAVQAFFAPRLSLAIEDPDDPTEDAIDVKFDVRTPVNRYYELARAATRDTGDIRKIRGREFLFRYVEDVGVSVGLERQTAESLDSADSLQDAPQTVDDLQPGRDEEQSVSVFADGIAISLDPRWSSDRMRRNPRARR
jgi:hypothetical protein